jgi:ABC-type glycerol-3-phosphate transport system permease component
MPASRIVKRALRYAVLVVLAVIVLFPIYITVVNSLLRPDQVAARPPILFPTSPEWGSYSAAFDDGHLGTYLRNSFIVSVLITTAQVVTAVLAAYAFAFLDFPFKRTLFVLFLATLMVPFEATIVTNRQTIVDLGWFDSYPALVVPFLATGFGAFLLRQAFLQVPRDLQDAAALDGYGHWRFLLRVVVPLARPAIGALAVFSFLLVAAPRATARLTRQRPQRGDIQSRSSSACSSSTARICSSMRRVVGSLSPISAIIWR